MKKIKIKQGKITEDSKGDYIIKKAILDKNALKELLKMFPNQGLLLIKEGMLIKDKRD